MVAAEVLGCAVNREVRAVLEWPQVDGRRGGRVDDHARRVRRSSLEVRHRQERVRGRLQEDEVGAVRRRPGLVELDVARDPTSRARRRGGRCRSTRPRRARSSARARAARARAPQWRRSRKGRGARGRPRARRARPRRRPPSGARSAGSRNGQARRCRTARSSLGRRAPRGSTLDRPNASHLTCVRV